jgi:N-acetylglucosaminyldiphosphoundecaprenol N-acetyl-beta-D-mannosaminyltransferase
MATPADRRSGLPDRRQAPGAPPAGVDRRAGPGDRRRISLMEMPIDCVTEDEAVAQIGDALEGGRGGWVITPNLDHLRAFRREPELREPFREADLVLADGMPLVWASQIQNTPLPERVAGSDLIWSLSSEAGRKGASVFLVGGNPGTAEEAGEALARSSPGLDLAGAHCPPRGFERDQLELARIERSLRRAHPDLVYVGLPLDKQVKLIPRLRRSAPSAWFLGLGISFSFVTGDVRRAPRWMQRSGLEWIHRLVQEPRRLARRYLVEGIPFSAALFAHALRRRLA